MRRDTINRVSTLRTLLHSPPLHSTFSWNMQAKYIAKQEIRL